MRASQGLLVIPFYRTPVVLSLGVAATGYPSLIVTGGLPSQTYQWQERTRSSGGTWVNSSGAGNTSSVFTGATDGNEYRCQVTSDVTTITPTVMVFGYTGSVVDFTLSSSQILDLDLYGAQGASLDPNTNSQIGGLGGRLQMAVNVAAGTAIRMTVGQAGVYGSGLTGAFGGGGARLSGFTWSFTQGGGATDIRVGGTTLADRYGVAGGGGGSGCFFSSGPRRGGAGGGLIGGTGDPGNITSATTPGGGGTQSAGGSASGSGSYPSSAGTLGVGGNAGYSFWGPGSSGGGGYYGGGGCTGASNGSDCGGAGGGSSFSTVSATSVVHTSGVRSSDGLALIILR